MGATPIVADLDPQTKAKPKTNTPSADHHDGALPGDGVTPDSLRKAGLGLASENMRHSAASAQRAATMLQMQKGMGNKFAQDAARRAAVNPSRITASRPGNPRDKLADAQAVKPGEKHGNKAGDKSAPPTASNAIHSTRTPSHASAQSAHPAAKHGAGDKDHATQAPAASPAANAPAVAIKPPVAPAPTPLDLPFTVTPEALPSGGVAVPRLDLKVAPEKPVPGQGQQPARDPQEDVRSATEAFAALARDANRFRQSVIERADAISLEIISTGRNAFLQIDVAIDGNIAATRQAAQRHRALLSSTSDDSLKALEKQHHLARVTLSGAAAFARKNLSTARGGLDKHITEIREDLGRRFQEQFKTRANALITKTNEVKDHLLDSETQRRVGTYFQGKANLPKVVQEAQAEAQAAAVNPIFKQLVVDLQDSCKEQVKYLLEKAYTAVPPKGGQSVEGIVIEFGNRLRATAIGADADHPVPPTPPSAEPAKPDKHKDLPLLVQGEHTVATVFGQAWHAMEEQFKGAKEAILYARDNSLAGIDGQEAAALAQFATIRKGAKESVENAARSGVHAVSGGVRSALPAYDDAMERSAKSLTDAALRGSETLRQVKGEGLAGVKRSMQTGMESQLGRLDGTSASVVSGLESYPQQAGKAASDAQIQAQTEMATAEEQAVKTVSGYTAGQAEGLTALAKTVSGSSAAYTKQLDTFLKNNVDKARNDWFPVKASNDKSEPKPATTEPEQKTPEQVLQEFITIPETKIVAQEDRIADDLSATLQDKGGTAFHCIDKFNLDEDGLINALHGLTSKQGKAVEHFYHTESHGRDLREDLKSEYDKHLRGLDENEYYAAINYLSGNGSEGALWELREAAGYWSDGKRAEKIMRDLTADQRRQLTGSPDWPAVSSSVRDGLSGIDLDVFEALSASKINRADSIRLKQSIDRNRDSDDKEAFAKSLESYKPAGDTEAERKANFEDMKKEFSGLKGVLQPGETVGTRSATDIFKTYITRPVTTFVDYGGGGMDGGVSTATEVTYTVEGADLALAEAIAVDGPGSTSAKGARLLREATRKEGKPELEPLENAIVDPRLNPSLNKGVKPDDETKQKILAEQDKIYMAYAELARQYGLGSTATTPAEARQEAAERLKSHYDNSSEKGRAGAQYVNSLVTAEVPDAAAAIRYAILGVGTDEDLIHRTFSRMSRKEIDAARDTYKVRYGDDMDHDLGTDGSWFGDLSGDDKLKAQREMYGVPQNEKESFELALYTIQQQKDSNSWSIGGDYNKGSAQEKAMNATDARLREAAGGKVTTDDHGRMVIDGGNFKPDGKFVGPGGNAALSDIHMASITAENYSARLDELADFVVGVIAIVGAVVATALTLGGASVLVLVAVAAATGAATMTAKQLIRGGRYGWEEAGIDLGMTAVQMIGAGVGASLGKSLGAATMAAEEAAALAEAGGVQAARNAATQAVKLNIARRATDAAITGAATGAIHGMGSTALNEQTWEKGIGAGLGNVALGTLKGSAAGAASGAVTGALDASPVGQYFQKLAFEGSLVNSVSNMLLRGAGHSVISTISGVVGTGTDLAFDAATGRFKGSWHDAMNTLKIAGRDAAIRGFFEGQGASVGQRYHNISMRAQEQQRTEARRALAAVDLERSPLPLEVVETLPAGLDGKPRTVQIELDETGMPLMRVTKSATPQERDEAVLGFYLAWRAARAAFQEPTAQEDAAETDLTDGTKRPPSSPDDPNVETPAARQRRTDESAAAGIAGSRFTGDAAHRIAVGGIVRGITSHDVTEAVTNLKQGLLADGVITGEGTAEQPISLKTNAVDQNGEPIKVNVRIETVELAEIQKTLKPGEEVPVAQFEREADGDYVIRISKGALKSSAERGLIHELVEIQHLHKPLAEGATDLSLPEQAHALQMRSKAIELSPHDRGRLAEIELLARKVNSTPEGQRAKDELQRLAQELGLLARTRSTDKPGMEEASAAVIARRGRAMDPAEEGGAPLSPLARSVLEEAIKAAADNPFLKPLTGNAENDIPILADRLAKAKEYGEVSEEDFKKLPSTISDDLNKPFSQPSDLSSLKGKNPILLEIIEQIRQLVADDHLLQYRKREPNVDAALLRLGTKLRDAHGQEFSKLFSLAQAMAAKAGAWKTWTGDVPVDAATVAAAKARWGDAKRFQDWPEFKAKYLEANRRQADEPGAEEPLEFNRLERMRDLFQEWASGTYMKAGSRFPSQLESPDLGPTLGYEAHYEGDFEGPAHAAKIKIVETEIEASFNLNGDDKNQTTMSAANALALRRQLLADAETLRDEALKLANKNPNKVTTPEALAETNKRIAEMTALAKAKVGQAVRVTEAIGEVAGRIFARNKFPGAIVIADHGAGVPDLVIRIGDRIIVIECKGGSADLGTRRAVDAEGNADPTKRVEQGKYEYLESLAHTMMNSGDPAKMDLGAALLLQINQPGFEYYLVKQPLNDDGSAKMPIVEKFDMTAGPWKGSAATPPTPMNESDTAATAGDIKPPDLETE